MSPPENSGAGNAVDGPAVIPGVPPARPPDDASIAALAELLRQSERIVAFTGAGISTESGVPDFRTPGSPWMQHRPIDFADFLASAEARAEAWRRKFVMDDIYAGAQPSRGHLALKALADRGKLKALITQNIDGLHAASGIPGHQIMELHGNGTYAHCLSCSEPYALATVRHSFEMTGEAPMCACGGFIKSATVSFGQAVPPLVLKRALSESKDCDLFVVIGSSLVVRPASALPQIAHESGATLAILNREPTPLDKLARLNLRADIGALLEPAVRLAFSG